MAKTKGICRWCGQDRRLIKAHILPKSLYELNNDVQFYLFNPIGNERYKRFPQGIYDPNILCAECDGDIIGRWDKVAAETFVDRTIVRGPISSTFSIPIYLVPKTDPQKIAKFIMSVIWRASVSTLPCMRHFSLGPHETPVLDALKSKNDTEIEKYACQLLFNTDSNSKRILLPGRRRHSGMSYVMFAANSFSARISRPIKKSPLDCFDIKTGKPIHALGMSHAQMPNADKLARNYRAQISKFGAPSFRTKRPKNSD